MDDNVRQKSVIKTLVLHMFVSAAATLDTLSALSLWTAT
jgi:hypothetical protein